MQTPAFLCNELGSLQAILGNLPAICLSPFQAILGTFRQLRVLSGDLGGGGPKPPLIKKAVFNKKELRIAHLSDSSVRKLPPTGDWLCSVYLLIFCHYWSLSLEMR